MPDGSISTIFTGNPEQRLSFLEVGRRVNHVRFSNQYIDHRSQYASLVIAPVSLNVLDDNDSYFKFNLDTINLYNLIRLESDSFYRDQTWPLTPSYGVLRTIMVTRTSI